jgi:hypothetical protein
MKRLAILLLAACAAQQPAPPAANTPPPPMRPEDVVIATGVVRDPSGAPLPGARVRVWQADPACTPLGGAVTRPTGAGGTYEIAAGTSVGPQYDACVILEFAAGGAVERIQRNARYASESVGERLRIDVTLPPATLLTRAEADRLIEVVRRAMHGSEHDAVEELALYLREDTTEQRRRLRGIAGVRLVSDGDRKFEYELTGTRPGTSVRVAIEQDSLTRIRLIP